MSLSKKIKHLEKCDISDLIKQFYNFKIPAPRTYVYSYNDTLTHNYSTGNTIPINSISEDGITQWYTYEPKEICNYVRQNIKYPVVILPLTIWPVMSLNNMRQDGLIIFNNSTKFVYLYLPLFDDMPKHQQIEFLIESVINMLNKAPYFLEYIYIKQLSKLITYECLGIGLDHVYSLANCILYLQNMNNWADISKLEVLDKFDKIYNTIQELTNFPFNIYDNEMLFLTFDRNQEDLSYHLEQSALNQNIASNQNNIVDLSKPIGENNQISYDEQFDNFEPGENWET